MKYLEKGFWFALAATLCNGIYYGINVKGIIKSDLILLAVITILGASLTGTFTWWILTRKKESVTNVQGVIIGGLVGLIAHPISWTLMLFVQLFFLEPTLFSVVPKSVTDALIYPFALSTITLIYAGWFTIPAGALTGWFIVKYRGNKNE